MVAAEPIAGLDEALELCRAAVEPVRQSFPFDNRPLDVGGAGQRGQQLLVHDVRVERRRNPHAQAGKQVIDEPATDRPVELSVPGER